MALWQGLTSATRNRHIARISLKKGTIARIRYSRGAREALATSVKVAGICASKELDRPLAGGAGVVGGSVPTAGAASPTRAAGPVAQVIRVSVLEERWHWK
jgi:hypothetical protein